MDLPRWVNVLDKILSEDLTDEVIIRKVKKISNNLNDKHTFKCDMSGCKCRSISTFLQSLFKVGDNNSKRNLRKLYIIKLLFKENIIQQEMITDKKLIKMFDSYGGWIGERLLIDFLIGFEDENPIIPIERFLNLRSEGHNILNMALYNTNDEDGYRYFKFFYEKGAKLDDCHLKDLSKQLIQSCRLSLIKYLLSIYQDLNLPKDIIHQITLYIFNFNLYTTAYRIDMPLKGYELPILLKVLERSQLSKNLKYLSEIKELLELALDHGYDITLKDEFGADIINYLHTYHYDEFIPERLQSMVDNRFTDRNKDGCVINEKELEDILSEQYSTYNPPPANLRETLISILGELKPYKYTKNALIIEKVKQKLKKICDALSFDPKLKNAVYRILCQNYDRGYCFFDIADLDQHWVPSQ